MKHSIYASVLIAAIGFGQTPAHGQSLEELANVDSKFYKEKQTFVAKNPRERALAAAARGVGVRGGFKHEAERLNAALQGKFKERLNREFDYTALTLQNGLVVPPVITSLSQVQEANGERFLYLTKGAFEIVKDARLATQPPSWRDYLVLPIRNPRPPERLTAETRKEKKLWNQEVKSGWARGVKEAREAFRTGLRIAKRDLQGMKRYHTLRRQGIVSLPKVDVNKIKYRTTDDGKRAFVGETTLRMRVEPKFISRSKTRGRKKS